MARLALPRIGPHAGVSAVLFLSLFAGQAGLIAITPVLPALAGDFDVSTAAAGQLRTVTGLVAGVTALALGMAAGRIGLGRQLLAGSGLLPARSLASAAASLVGLMMPERTAFMAVMDSAVLTPPAVSVATAPSSS